MAHFTIIACSGPSGSEYRELYREVIDGGFWDFMHADVVIATHDSRRIILPVFSRLLSNNENALYVEDDERLPKNVIPKLSAKYDFVTLEY